LARDRQRQPGRVGPAVGQELEPVQPDLGRLLDQRPGRLLPLVPVGCRRAYRRGAEAGHPVAQVPLFFGQVERELGHRQAFGISNRFWMFAARPRSPLAFSLPVMNIITGLPLPETTLMKSTGATVTASFGSCSGVGDRTHLPSAMTSSYVSVPPSVRPVMFQWVTALVDPARSARNSVGNFEKMASRIAVRCPLCMAVAIWASGVSLTSCANSLGSTAAKSTSPKSVISGPPRLWRNLLMRNLTCE